MTWEHGEKKCLLCDRPGYPTDYYKLGFEGSEPTAVIPLCQYHKATYMSHGIKRLDGMMKESIDSDTKRMGVDG